MIATSEPVSRWISHVWGDAQLAPKPGMMRLQEAVDLNRTANTIISTFGNKEFQALVGFMDMRGFSDRTKGMRPAQVRDIAAPFVEAVVSVATDHHCFIDKTIGDEVMIVMPYFSDDAVLADIGLRDRDPFLLELSAFVADVLIRLSSERPALQLSAGFAVGPVTLGRVGNRDFAEWTVYGNVVNAAKRLQGVAANLSPGDSHALAVGALVSDDPEWKEELDAWVNISDHIGTLRLINPTTQNGNMKGVGEVRYLSAQIARKEDGRG